MTENAMERLLSVCAAWGLTLSEGQAQQFDRFDALLTEWNDRIDLTSVLDPVELVDRHYLDSLSVLRYGGWDLTHASILDLGSGAGFPGVPLAILCPDSRFTLLDALQKRVDYLSLVIDALRLHAEARHERAELLAREELHRECYDFAVSRAVAALPALMELMLPFVRVGGVMIAYKGPQVFGELEQSGASAEKLGGRLLEPIEAPIPGRDFRHVLVAVEKVQPTPVKYPRKPGIPTKRPLA